MGGGRAAVVSLGLGFWGWGPPRVVPRQGACRARSEQTKDRIHSERANGSVGKRGYHSTDYPPDLFTFRSQNASPNQSEIIAKSTFKEEMQLT